MGTEIDDTASMDDEIFLIKIVDPTEEKAADEAKSGCKIGKWACKIQDWIKRKTPNLLRPFGDPANVKPFEIDTGNESLYESGYDHTLRWN